MLNEAVSISVLFLVPPPRRVVGFSLRDKTFIPSRNPGNNVWPGDPYSAKSRNIGNARTPIP